MDNDNYEMETPLNELFVEAIMSESPLIIVEGIDDIAVYERIANHSKIREDIQVIAIENIRDYDSGCDNVIKAITDLQDMIREKEENKKYILGIIDRDARFYRNDIPELEGLFILKYYSYESHFVGEQGLKFVLPIVTNSYEEMIDETVVTKLKDGLSREYEDLYYISLEALKNACDKYYNGKVCYKQKAGRILSEDSKKSILNKLDKDGLDNFASERGITKYSLKNIAKGKWLIFVYAKVILNNLINLHISCRNGKINQCQYCKVKKYDQCMFKLKKKFRNIGQIETLLLQSFDWNELEYIIDRVNLLT